ncbi:MAG: replication endonuclease [Candidatus Reddybacter sp.]
MINFGEFSELDQIGTRECKTWRDDILSRHSGIAKYLMKAYRRTTTARGYVTANKQLMALSKSLVLKNTRLKLDSDIDSLGDRCKAMARKAERVLHRTYHSRGEHYALNAVRQIVEDTGIKFPLDEKHTEDEMLAAFARVIEPNWWRSQLKPLQWRKMEDFIRRLGFVNKHDEIYISDFSLRRRMLQKNQSQKLMVRIEVDNQEGIVLSLAEIAEHSPSNPIVRRAELMVRMRGFEDFATNSTDNFQGVFFTLTCPSKFHATLSSGKPNTNYQGATVAEAQAHLNTVWQRTRSAYDRKQLTPFGMRVVEPHHDGTPHWHLLLFFPEDQVEQASKIFNQYALEVDGDEHGASEHRLKVVAINPEKGSATGYIAKYIAKNIDGHQVDFDHYGYDAIQSAIRIEAWASINGIRQFQQIGGASITVWRELRRLAEYETDKKLLKKLIQAADEGDWASYNELMGGMICPRNQRPIRPMLLERKETNRYGEAVKVIKGLLFGSLPMITRPFEWVTRLQPKTTKNIAEDGVGYGAALSTAPPG